MQLVSRRLVVLVLLSSLGAAGCDLNPENPVLNGDVGPSSLSPSDEAFSTVSEGAKSTSGKTAPEVPGVAPAPPAMPGPSSFEEGGKAPQEYGTAEHD